MSSLLTIINKELYIRVLECLCKNCVPPHCWIFTDVNRIFDQGIHEILESIELDREHN